MLLTFLAIFIVGLVCFFFGYTVGDFSHFPPRDFDPVADIVIRNQRLREERERLELEMRRSFYYPSYQSYQANMEYIRGNIRDDMRKVAREEIEFAAKIKEMKI